MSMKMKKTRKKKGKREKGYIKNDKLSRNKDDLGWTRLNGLMMTNFNK